MSRHIPSEIVEEILVNLSVKPLLRFSSVSKSWNSMISDPKFVSRHSRRADRERIVIEASRHSASTCPISSVSTDNATPLICPQLVYNDILASCGDLWCVHDGYSNSMYLWNPSTNAYKKLTETFEYNVNCTCFYGLGYDSLGDDYKMVKIFTKQCCNCKDGKFKVYSLRSDSWREIEPYRARQGLPFGGCVPLHGALHWLHGVTNSNSHVIVSFNLSTDKYAEVAVPQVSQPYSCRPEITVLRGKLCMHPTSERGGTSFTFILWEMQEYGVAESWTKTFVIDHWNIFANNRISTPSSLRPLYIYDDGKLLVTASSHGVTTMFIYIDDKIEPRVVSYSCRTQFFASLYSETLVSPPTYCTPT